MDYQTQLMLLGQEHKKRLMIARAEQSSLARHSDGQSGIEQAPPQSTSPSSRGAPSPRPMGITASTQGGSGASNGDTTAGTANNDRTQPSPPQVQDQQPATPAQSHKATPEITGARDTGKKVSYHLLYTFLSVLILNSNGQPRKTPAQRRRHLARVPNTK